MGENSKIEWTHHTFNPWWGCEKVSPACANCYAEAFSKRTGNAVWGADAPRRFFGDHHWNEPLRWDHAAEKAGARHRVFCASMADVFERRPDLERWRERLWNLVDRTPHLDWLLLTKRPENVRDMVPRAWLASWPGNVWSGATVENQEWAERRIPSLLAIPAKIRFLSVEPLLGLLDLGPWTKPEFVGRGGISWVIAGGESGGRHRQMDWDWIRAVRDRCEEARIPFFLKQGFGFAPVKLPELDGQVWDEVPAGAPK